MSYGHLPKPRQGGRGKVNTNARFLRPQIYAKVLPNITLGELGNYFRELSLPLQRRGQHRRRNGVRVSDLNQKERVFRKIALDSSRVTFRFHGR
jgi:hypothetical protein